MASASLVSHDASSPKAGGGGGGGGGGCCPLVPTPIFRGTGKGLPLYCVLLLLFLQIVQRSELQKLYLISLFLEGT